MRFRFSAELEEMLTELTPQQRRALPRVLRHLSEGGSLTGLLKGPDKICCWSTYYKAGKGWYHQERWRAALEKARTEYDEAMLESAVQDAVDQLRRATPLASKSLLQEIQSGLREQAGYVNRAELGLAERGLLLLAEKCESESVRIRAWSELARLGLKRRDQAMRSAIAVLDRADIKTAMKASGDGEQRWEALLQELTGLGEDDEAMADVEAEEGNISGIGLRAARDAGASASE